MADIETKFFEGRDIKASESADQSMRFEGYLACFDNVDSYGDVIVKGAFSRTIAEAKNAGKTIPVLQQHGTYGALAGDDTPIGYYEDMYEDAKGLYVKGVLFSTTRGTDMYKLLKESPKGAMGMSIGYCVISKRCATEEERSKTGAYQYLTDIELREGSIVTFPANNKARVEDVKAEALRWRELEKSFRSSGFSGSEAVKAVAVVKAFNSQIPTEENKTLPEEDLPDVKGLFDEVITALDKSQELKKCSLTISNIFGQLK